MLKRMGLVQGPRDEILTELNELGKDAARNGKPEKAEKFARAVKAVEDGDGWVIVHNQAYHVVEDAGE